MSFNPNVTPTKITYEGDTLLDLTQDTVTAETLAEGVTAHTAAGVQITGTMATGTEWGDITGTLSDQTDLNNELTNIREVAQGKTKSYVVSDVTNPSFNTQNDEIEITQAFIDINGVSHYPSELKLGDNIYVKELDVPDRWCSRQQSESVLPSGYVQLEYIETSGTQYINTGLTSKRNTIVELDVAHLDAQNTVVLGTSWETSFSLFAVAGQNNTLNFFFGTSVYSFTANINTRYTINLRLGQIIVDDTVFTYDYREPRINDTICINALSDGSRKGNNRYYRATFYEGETMVGNFLPAKRNSDNAIGMYDTVTSTFFANSGSGYFIDGAIYVGISAKVSKLETAKVPVTDVQVNGSSVVSNTIANIDLSGKQDTLTAGQNITITNNVISASGGGSSVIAATKSASSDVNPTATGTGSVAAGYNAQAPERKTIAIGQGARALQAGSIAIGESATASHANSFAIGTASTTSQTFEISVGDPLHRRKITNVADGSVSSGSKDAVNGGQLYTLLAALEARITALGG